MNHRVLLAVAILATPGLADPPRRTVELRDADLFGALEQASAVLGEFEYVAVAPDNRRMDATLTGTADEILARIGERYGAPRMHWGGVNALLPEAEPANLWSGVLAAMRSAGLAPDGLAVSAETAASNAAAELASLGESILEAGIERCGRFRQTHLVPNRLTVVPLDYDAGLSDMAGKYFLYRELYFLLQKVVSIVQGVPVSMGNEAMELEDDDLWIRTRRGSVWLGSPPDDDPADDVVALAWRPHAATTVQPHTPVLGLKLDLVGRATFGEWLKRVAEAAGVEVSAAAETPAVSVGLRLRSRPLWFILHTMSAVSGLAWSPWCDSDQYRLSQSETITGAVFSSVSAARRISMILHTAEGNGVDRSVLVWGALRPEHRSALRAGRALRLAELPTAARNAIELVLESRAYGAIGLSLDAAIKQRATARRRCCLVFEGGREHLAIQQGGGRLTVLTLQGPDGPMLAGISRYVGVNRLAIPAQPSGSYGQRAGSPARTRGD